MIKRVARFLGFGVLFLFFVVIFLPKDALWYQMEERIKSFHITIDNETLTNGTGRLEVKEPIIYYDNLELFRIKELTLSLWLLSQEVTLHKLYAGKDLKLLKGISIDTLSLKEYLFNPLRIDIEAKGNFGSLKGAFSLTAKELKLIIKPTALLRSKRAVMRLLKQSKEGYIYVKRF